MAFETLIDAPALKRLLSGSSSPVIIDARFDLADAAAGRRQYLAGHIPGAHFADLNEDLAAPVQTHTGRHPLPKPAALAATLGSWGIGRDTQVVVYDALNGSFAARTWWLLRWVGHRAVAVLDGGLSAWSAGGGTLVSGAEPDAAGAPYPIELQDHLHVDVAQVAANVGSRTLLVIDARAPERYAGEVEPIDPVAGHVPGAVNAPFAASLGADGRFLSVAALRALWQARLAGQAPEQVIAMCGSGVTACHDLLSLEAAGLTGARLYPGSWSEWIRDPTRPTAKGRVP